MALSGASRRKQIPSSHKPGNPAGITLKLHMVMTPLNKFSLARFSGAILGRQAFFLVGILPFVIASILPAADEKNDALLSLEKRIESDRVSYLKSLQEHQAGVRQKLERLNNSLQDLKTGSWAIEERNQGSELIKEKIAILPKSLSAFLEVENQKSTAASSSSSPPDPVTASQSSDSSTAPLATKANTLPHGKYVIKVWAWMNAEIYINGKKYPIDPRGEGNPYSFDYEVSGPVQFRVRCSAYTGLERHGFGFIMQDAEGKQIVTTKSGWKSYRPANFEQWFQDKELKDLGKVAETGLPNFLDATLPAIWDARKESAVLCHLVWGL